MFIAFVRSAPLVLDEFCNRDSQADEPAPTARASNKGCLPKSFAEYLQLHAWPGRQTPDDKSGVIPGMDDRELADVQDLVDSRAAVCPK
jgi:hypothetical protein